MSADRILRAEVGVIGAGPAGLAAAARLARAGLSVVVLDEGQRAGGQIFRQLPVGSRGFPAGSEPPSHDRGHSLLADFAACGASLRTGATVWDAAPGRVWFEQDGASWLLCCERLLLATGAYDLSVPFPGWTLPGVLTTGALQVAVRGFGLVPGRRALVAGSGPLLLPTAASLLAAGVQIVGVLEAASRWRMLRALPGVLGNGARLREALWYLRRLRAGGVRVQWSTALLRCLGDGGVQRAVIGRVDAAGRPRPGTERTVDVDVVGVGYGLVPSIEIGLRLGCAAVYDPARGGHHLVVDRSQRTGLAGVWAAGEVCGIGGAEVARAEGELAAAAILHDRGGPPVAPELVRRAAGERRAADLLLRAFEPLPGIHELAAPDTIVCRCEDVPLQHAREAARLHGPSHRAIKLGCRAGMGPCQARICGPSLQALATGEPRTPPDLPSVQVPLKPVRTSTLIDAPRA